MKYIIITVCVLIIVFSVFYVIRQVVRSLKSKGCGSSCSTCSMQCGCSCNNENKNNKDK